MPTSHLAFEEGTKRNFRNRRDVHIAGVDSLLIGGAGSGYVTVLAEQSAKVNSRHRSVRMTRINGPLIGCARSGYVTVVTQNNSKCDCSLWSRVMMTGVNRYPKGFACPGDIALIDKQVAEINCRSRGGGVMTNVHGPLIGGTHSLYVTVVGQQFPSLTAASAASLHSRSRWLADK